jgi:hypothetical protein
MSLGPGRERDLGANGYIAKRSGPKELIEQIIAPWP